MGEDAPRLVVEIALTAGEREHRPEGRDPGVVGDDLGDQRLQLGEATLLVADVRELAGEERERVGLCAERGDLQRLVGVLLGLGEAAGDDLQVGAVVGRQPAHRRLAEALGQRRLVLDVALGVVEAAGLDGRGRLPVHGMELGDRIAGPARRGDVLLAVGQALLQRLGHPQRHEPQAQDAAQRGGIVEAAGERKRLVAAARRAARDR